MGLILSPVLAILRRVPPIAWVILALLAWGGWQRHQAQSAAKTLRQHDAAVAAETIQAAQESQAESLRRLDAQTEIANVAHTRAAAAASAADAAAAAAVRLRARLAAAAPSGRPADPAAAPGGQATACPAGVPAELLERAVDAARRYAALADQRGAAGEACERSYESLSAGHAPTP